MLHGQWGKNERFHAPALRRTHFAMEAAADGHGIPKNFFAANL